MTRLLTAVWTDEAAPTEHCAAMRRVMGLQNWPHRLASGFPFDDVRVAGRTGSLPTVRNEVGVVEYPDGGRCAVAGFTRSASTAANLPGADTVIGTVARMAVDALRARCPLSHLGCRDDAVSSRQTGNGGRGPARRGCVGIRS